MHIGTMKSSVRFACKNNVWILAFIWSIGMFAGVLIAHLYGAGIVSLMRAAADCRVSIVGLIFSNIFPLLLTAAAVYCSVALIAELFLFLRALSYGFLLFGILLSFGTGGWIICTLLLFSSGMINLAIMYLMLYKDLFTAEEYFGRLAIIISAAMVTTAADYLYISPFLAKILDHF